MIAFHKKPQTHCVNNKKTATSTYYLREHVISALACQMDYKACDVETVHTLSKIVFSVY